MANLLLRIGFVVAAVFYGAAVLAIVLAVILAAIAEVVRWS